MAASALCCCRCHRRAAKRVLSSIVFTDSSLSTGRAANTTLHTTYISHIGPQDFCGNAQDEDQHHEPTDWIREEKGRTLSLRCLLDSRRWCLCPLHRYPISPHLRASFDCCSVLCCGPSWVC
ncbi:hypothetical protein FKP32DRAFT_276115 [Trametes sanguinea]|nr:hypothetical protein FKP32DRAFT_276115 [Trametes sanguinea]